MKKLLIVAAILMTSFCKSYSQSNTTSIRTKTNFNSDWKFIKGDNPAFKNVDFIDTQWRKLQLPHDWMIEGPFDKTNPSEASSAYLPGGIGWYRKTFTLPDSLKSKKIFIQFDGIYMNSDVWINGQFLGRYPYGYSLIEYDLTGLVKPGQTNVMAVRVDNSLEPSARYYAGAGIYRNTWLVVTDRLHFDNKTGVFVAYKNVTEQAATIACNYKIISNAFPESEFHWWRANTALNKRITKQVTITTTVLDGKGIIVASKKSVQPIGDFKEFIFTENITINKPKLWSSSNPVLYQLKSSLEYDGKIADDQVTLIGIRSIAFTKEKGMLVNGRQEKIKGVCLHQDAGSLGNAVPDGVWQYRLQKLKDMGANAIRCSHHPFAPEFYSICDSMGLYVMDEAFDEWNKGYGFTTENTAGKMKYGYHLYFNQWAETDLRAMIQRDRNHPSVIMYSIGNEIPNQQAFDGALLASKLQNICHDEDPTRLVTAGCDLIAFANENGFLDTLDIAGYNYVARFTGEKVYGGEKERYPNRLYLGTETYFDTNYWLAVRDNDYVMGDFIWAGFDYLGEGIAWPKRGWDACLIDMAGAERPEYYLRKSYWSKEPVVRIAIQNGKSPESEWHPRPAASHWNWKWNASFLNNVFVYSNCDAVELLMNDSSFGKKVVDKDLYYAKWEIPFYPGKLKAIGYKNGKAVTEHLLQTAGDAAGIKLVSNKQHLLANGTDVAVIEINVVDKNGIPVNDNQQEISVSIDGPATLIGLDNGDQRNHDQYKTSTRKTFNGRLLATVQATDKAGKVVVRFSGTGLQTGVVEINTK